MKLKLQFWKTNKVLAVTVLEQDGLPKNKNGEIISTYSADNLYLSYKSLIIGTSPNTIGKISSTLTDDPENFIDRIVNAITDELFLPVQQELKEGDIVTINGSTTYVLAKIFPENYSPRYVLTANNKVYLIDTVEPVYPILQRCKLTKDITDTTETYTWEM